MPSETTPPLRPAAPDATGPTPPLCVDLDGTLIRTDLLLESFLLLARQKPWLLLALPFWLLKGRSHLKQRIAEAVDFAPELLPYNTEFLGWLREAKAAGRPLILATASNRRLAQPVADHLGLFDQVLASDATTNLKGRRKLEALQAQFGAGGFDYAADARADLPVWREARAAILVHAPAGLARQLEGQVPIERIFPKPGFSLQPFVKAIRVRQWVKNVLVFLPLLAGQAFGEPALLLKALIAFCAVSLSASAMYVLNDLLDLPADRGHRTKQRRPFASGALPVLTGLWLCPLLLAAGLAIAASLSLEALGLVVLYVALTTLYSFWLKRRMLIDVFVLALLYTLRVLIGSVATGLLSSPWLLGFSVFTFLSLAAAKRGAELLYLELAGRTGASGRAYYVWDRHAISGLGQGAAFGAALVLALYLQSHEVRLLYAQPTWLWLLVPMILYWLSRIWMVTLRGTMDDDPIVFAISDRVTWGIAIAGALIVAMAKLAPFPLPGAQP
jgi:4-hydroxybenzoate polyprenyltransferase/phosphoserine phosphatase